MNKRLIHDNDPAITVEATTSQGKGGQHVNKNMTRAVVYFSIPRSTSLTDEQKQRLLCHDDRQDPHAPVALRRVCNLITADGSIRVESQASRSLVANKADAVTKLNQLLTDALAQAAPRTTTPSKRFKQKKRAAIQQRRLTRYKQRRSGITD